MRLVGNPHRQRGAAGTRATVTARRQRRPVPSVRCREAPFLVVLTVVPNAALARYATVRQGPFAPPVIGR